jgi:hypothetical protein
LPGRSLPPTGLRGASKGGSWPRVERARSRGSDRRSQPVGCSRRATGERQAAKARGTYPQRSHPLARGCSTVRRDVPRISLQLRRPCRCAPGDRYRAEQRRSARGPHVCRSVRRCRAGRVLAPSAARKPTVDHADTLMSWPLMLLCPLGMAAMGGIAWLLRRLPGKRTERIAPVARRSNCLALPHSQPKPVDDFHEKDAATDV